MARQIAIIRWLFASILLPALAWGAAASENRPRLLAYYYSGDQTATPKYTASQIPVEKLTHLIHAAVQPAPAADGSIVIPPGTLEPVLVPRAHAAGVRVLICVQGAAEVFAKIAADPAARAKFAQSLKDFIVRYQYDGVDLDWEVPQGPAGVANCTALMQAIRDVLPRGQYLLSMATSSTPGHWGEYDFNGLTPIVDFFNVMTYDFHGPWTDHTGHNSPLFPNTADTGHDGSLDDSVNIYLQAGVPPEQINLGLPFYGYEFPVSGFSAACKCEKTTISRNYGPYIKQRVGRDGWARRFDAISMQPYLVHEGDPPGFITYDDPQSIARKVTWALETRGLGGVFMWEISADYDGAGQDLMDAMYRSYLRAEAVVAPGAALPAVYAHVDRAVWVVKKAEAAVKGLKEFGLTDVDDRGDVVIRERYRGVEQDAKVHEVTGHLGRLTIEVIQPGHTSDAFRDFLDRHGDGVFAIVHRAGDPETVNNEAERMKAAGVGVLTEVTDGPATYTYFDTEPRGKYVLGLVTSSAAVDAPATATATVSHFGIVVRDSKPVSDFWASLGFPPLEIAHATPREDSRYRYQPLLLSFDVGWQRHTSITYEWIIPPSEPPNIYADFLKLHGEGVQHLGMPVPDLDAAIAHYAKLGCKVWQSGAWGNVGQKNSGRYAYMDTDRMDGVSVELIQSW